MIDLSHFPANADVQIFWGHRSSTAEFRAWTRPGGAQWLYILSIGSGGGGGAGFAAAVGSTKGGGGGGGSGSLASALFLASFERLYVNVKEGGAGDTVGTGAVGSNLSGVYTHPNTAVQNRLCIAGSTGTGTDAQGGVVGTAAGGAGGLGGVAGDASFCPLISTGFAVNFAAGRDGTAGNIATPLDTSVGTLLPILGGAGGGGYTAAGSASAGGKVNFAGYLPDLPGGTAGGVVAGRGSDGLWLPPYIFGGTGGGGTNDAVSTGGRGGDGIAPGAGGGGGGAGVTGGAGGNGGPGLVVMVAW